MRAVPVLSRLLGRAVPCAAAEDNMLAFDAAQHWFVISLLSLLCACAGLFIAGSYLVCCSRAVFVQSMWD